MRALSGVDVLVPSQYPTSSRMPAESIRRAAAVLRSGGLVAFPTETVYGLGANCYDSRAVARLFEAKRRPLFDPLIVHVASIEDADTVVFGLSETARELMTRFWPGPLTLVLPKHPKVPDIVTAGLSTVALRMPRHAVALELIRGAGSPLAAPSANRFGCLSPTTAQHVIEQLGSAIDLVLDGGPCEIGVESTIISLAGPPTLLRVGGLPLEEIEAVVGPLVRHPSVVPGEHAAGTPQAPGQLPHHYAPHTPLVLRQEVDAEVLPSRVGLLAFRAPRDVGGFSVVEVLSATGDLREAAANLFAALHRLDSTGVELIVAELAPDEGLGIAINDRLRRAAKHRLGDLPIEGGEL